jgi:hypothetical protein
MDSSDCVRLDIGKIILARLGQRRCVKGGRKGAGPNGEPAKPTRCPKKIAPSGVHAHERD